MRPIAFACARQALIINRLLLFSLLLFTALASQAQTKVSGHVTDGSGGPVANATVSVKGCVGVTTDSGGR